MATPIIWKNVAVSMQSALGANQAITAITKASPAVVTTTGTLPANGDYVKLTVQGMTQVNNRVFRVATASGTTFSLEGEDSTAYDTFSATGSNFNVVTYGVSITTITTISVSGGDYDFIDTTTIHLNQKTQIPGLPAATAYTMDNIWDPADAGLAAMKAATLNQSTRAFKFVFGTGGRIMVFDGFVGASGNPGGSAQQLVTTPSVITANGQSTFYSS